MSVAIPWSPRLQAYNPSEDAERPLRRGLAWDLLRETGTLDVPGIEVVDPPTASDDEIARVHAPAYVRAVRRYSADPALAHQWEAPQWGFVPGMDTVARAGMHEAAADVCGAALAGAAAVWAAGGARAFCPAPAGLHHALANRASGFCIYNDCALAVRGLLDRGAERVAYVDLDAHHGDGVQWIFYDDPRVLCVSVHERAPGFFPGTGGPGGARRGRGRGHDAERAAAALRRRRALPRGGRRGGGRRGAGVRPGRAGGPPGGRRPPRRPAGPPPGHRAGAASGPTPRWSRWPTRSPAAGCSSSPAAATTP